MIIVRLLDTIQHEGHLGKYFKIWVCKICICLYSLIDNLYMLIFVCRLFAVLHNFELEQEDQRSGTGE